MSYKSTCLFSIYPVSPVSIYPVSPVSIYPVSPVSNDITLGQGNWQGPYVSKIFC